MRRHIITEVVPPHFHFDPTFPVRGTEKFYMQTAASMARAGDVVTIEGDWTVPFYNKNLPAGVFCVPRGCMSPVDWVMVCNPRESIAEVIDRLNTPVDVVWSNLAIQPAFLWSWFRDTGAHHARKLAVISDYQRRSYQAAADHFGATLQVVPHGIDPDVFYPAPPSAPRSGVLFTSSPDRGWDVLQQIWSDYDLDPSLLRRLDYGNRTYTEQQVADALRQAAFWVHPGVGTELFCLAAAEAQACGATPVCVPTGALMETVRLGFKCTPKSFPLTLATAVLGELQMEDINRTRAGIQTWDQVTPLLTSEPPQ